MSPRGRPCWVSQLCFSSSEEVPAATNAVPDHGVNSLIFNAALHYAERSRLLQRHPLARRRRRRREGTRNFSQPFHQIGPDDEKRSSHAFFCINVAFLLHFDSNIDILATVLYKCALNGLTGFLLTWIFPMLPACLVLNHHDNQQPL